MDIFLYSCHYCGKDYQPKRRYKQRFCCNSCRVNSFNRKKQTGLSVAQKEIEKTKPLKIEKMSMAGIGNAAVGAMAGTAAVNLIGSLLTKEEDKPATKKDLMNLMEKQNKRFYPVKNIPQKIGYKALYDMQTQCVVYHPVKSL
jgi:hydrogenase maturation factor HypF (carbamoyltransferase family)